MKADNSLCNVCETLVSSLIKRNEPIITPPFYPIKANRSNIQETNEYIKRLMAAELVNYESILTTSYVPTFDGYYAERVNKLLNDDNKFIKYPPVKKKKQTRPKIERILDILFWRIDRWINRRNYFYKPKDQYV